MKLFLGVIHDGFDDAVNRIENPFVGQIKVIGEDGKQDLLSASSGRIPGERLYTTE